MYLVVYFSGIDEVKDCHHDEGVEDKSEMTRIHVVLLMDRKEIVISVYLVESATSYSASDLSIMPF